jgi:Ca-activated chloride channel family protein
MFRALFTILLIVAVAAAHGGEEQTITVNVDLVNIFLTVCNHKGRLISDLGRENFAVYEDGAAQVITNFSRETDAALTILLLVDTSGSVRDKLRFEQEAATQFLYATLRRRRDKAALITFEYSFKLQQDYTDDPGLLETAVRKIIAGGGTRLYDALHFSIQEKLAGSEDRKVIILITDGEDRSSRRSPQEVVDLAQRNNVSIYSVSMNGLGMERHQSDQSDRVLDMLASETGGRAFFPTKLENMASDFKQIDTELRSQYTIGYRSTNSKRDGTFRKIRIEVKSGKIVYAVRARSGYYAPAETVATRN